MEESLIKLGKKMRFLRIQRNLTQKMLCENICSQSYLSDIEKGLTSPSAYVLLSLSNRLGVSISYLLDSNESEEYIINLIELIRKSIENRDYKMVQEILQDEKKTLNSTPMLSQFNLWHIGICEFYLKNDINKALEHIDNALMMDKKYSFNYTNQLQILISKANIYMDNEDFLSAIEIYNQIHNQIKNLPEKIEYKLYIRLCYNHARSLRMINDLEKSLVFCDKGIKYCFKYHSMYGLGDLYFQKGLIYKGDKKYSLSKKQFEKAKIVYTLYENEKLITLVNKALLDLC